MTSDETFERDPDNPLEYPDRLPTEPQELQQTLLGPESECAGIEGFCLMGQISQLNLDFVIQPDLEAALIRTLVGAGDVSYAGLGTDRLGNAVEVFAVDDPDGQRQYLHLFDTRTGHYVGQETVLIRPQADLEDIDVPAVIGFDTITDRALIAPDELPPRR
ncbi:MAG: hypothetical protein QM655_04340 [Nocardioidaceae bacterium]